MKRGWLIVFAKAPRPGLVKTRMSPPLGLDQAAELYEAMLADVLDASARFAAELDLEPVLAVHPPDAVAEMVGRAPPSFRLQVQKGLGLAERMANAFAEAVAAGAPFALLRGSDSPALDQTQIEVAKLQLEGGTDVVLTPDGGGGYAMVGQKAAEPRLFEVPMSTDDMIDRTVSLCADLGLAVHETKPTFDLDGVDDLQAVESLPSGRASDLCPRTVEAIADLRHRGVL
ncbi:MAG: DUF2064 domain-containing protein [Myxococcota bacterium]